jgi:hypothetical protein
LMTAKRYSTFGLLSHTKGYLRNEEEVMIMGNLNDIVHSSGDYLSKLQDSR